MRNVVRFIIKYVSGRLGDVAHRHVYHLYRSWRRPRKVPVFTKPAQGHVRGAAVACGPSTDRLPIVAAGAAVSRMPNVQASAQLRQGAGGSQGAFILFHGQAEGAARCTRADGIAIPSDFISPENQAAADGHWGAAFAEAPCAGVAE